MIQRLDCSKCGINQADTDKPFVALPQPFICQDCFKQQISTEKRIEELERENKKLRDFLNDWDGHDSGCGSNRVGFEGCDEAMFRCDCGYEKAKDNVLEGLE